MYGFGSNKNGSGEWFQVIRTLYRAPGYGAYQAIRRATVHQTQTKRFGTRAVEALMGDSIFLKFGVSKAISFGIVNFCSN
jgi:hypothetical protein